ncbi:MAG: hypothetical protein WBB25_16865 [Sulfitobacter sp.]
MNAADSRFLVMGLTGLVLRDLLETMQDRFPGLEPNTVTNEDEATTRVSQTSGWKYAFLNLGPDDFSKSNLAKLFEAVGTRVVLFGEAAEEAATNSAYPVLVRPFMPDDVFRLLDKNS